MIASALYDLIQKILHDSAYADREPWFFYQYGKLIVQHHVFPLVAPYDLNKTTRK